MMVSSKFSNTSLLRWEFDKLDELRDEVESWFSLGKKIGLPVSGSKAVGVAGFVPVSGAYLASAIIVAGSDDNIFGSAVSMMRHYYVPDNIALLNILSIHPTKDKSRQTRLSELCAELPKIEIPVANWNAHTTYFDIPHRMEGIPIDESKGMINFEFYTWPGATLYDDAVQRQNANANTRASVSQVASINLVFSGGGGGISMALSYSVHGIQDNRPVDYLSTGRY